MEVTVRFRTADRFDVVLKVRTSHPTLQIQLLGMGVKGRYQLTNGILTWQVSGRAPVLETIKWLRTRTLTSDQRAMIAYAHQLLGEWAKLHRDNTPARLKLIEKMRRFNNESGVSSGRTSILGGGFNPGAIV